MRGPIVGKPGQAHAWNEDKWRAGGAAHSSSGRNGRPISATGQGRRAIHCVDSAGPNVAKVRSLTELCGLRMKVETYNAPNGHLQCKRCQSFGFTQGNCSYAPMCVMLTCQIIVSPQNSSHRVARGGRTVKIHATSPTTPTTSGLGRRSERQAAHAGDLRKSAALEGPEVEYHPTCSNHAN
jgi:hypothetical protein